MKMVLDARSRFHTRIGNSVTIATIHLDSANRDFLRLGGLVGRDLAVSLFMLGIQSFDEIHVYEGIAERTGVHFEREDVRRRGGCCGSLTELIRKARAAGDGTFYLPLDMWPADRERVELRKPWIVMS